MSSSSASVDVVMDELADPEAMVNVWGQLLDTPMAHNHRGGKLLTTTVVRSSLVQDPAAMSTTSNSFKSESLCRHLAYHGKRQRIDPATLLSELIGREIVRYHRQTVRLRERRSGDKSLEGLVKVSANADKGGALAWLNFRDVSSAWRARKSVPSKLGALGFLLPL